MSMPSEQSESHSRVSPDDALPEVEPPSAGFLLQLFVVPAIIVLIIVMGWLMFNWLAHMGDDPRELIDSLRRDNAARWQKAASLADWLNHSGNDPVKRDRVVAAELAALLDERVDAGLEERQEDDVRLRAFLCKALGEFKVDSVLPALLRAANTGRYENELLVRRSAIEAIALLAVNVEPSGSSSHVDLMPTLDRAASDPEEGIRAPAAFALGVLGSDDALRRLNRMLDDPHPTVRFNAATGLARHGDRAALDVLIEMLDPELSAALDSEIGEQARALKRIAIRKNALEAIGQFARQDPEIPTDSIQSAIATLLNSDDLEEPIRVRALSLQRELDRSTQDAIRAE